MLLEGRQHSPVRTADDGSVTVELDAEHPGAADEAYRGRRDHIASLAAAWDVTEPPPLIGYTDAEEALWQQVTRTLYQRHAHHACSAYLEAWETLDLPTGRIPELREVDERVVALSGFRMAPIAGELSVREFFATLARGTVPATQHLRHPSSPLRTIEADLVHEVVGHGVLVAHPTHARLHRLSGQAAAGLETDDALALLVRVFRATCELGLVAERGETLLYGAELLSCAAWIERVADHAHHPLDFAAIAVGRPRTLYVAASPAALEDELGAFLEDLDDDTPARLYQA